jgi:hypothetical protein
LNFAKCDGFLKFPVSELNLKARWDIGHGIPRLHFRDVFIYTVLQQKSSDFELAMISRGLTYMSNIATIFTHVLLTCSKLQPSGAVSNIVGFPEMMRLFSARRSPFRTNLIASDVSEIITLFLTCK